MISGGAIHRAFIGLVVSSLTMSAAATEGVNGRTAVDVRCAPAVTAKLDCVVHTVSLGGGVPLRMRVAGIDAPITGRALHTPAGVALLFLVDTSDPRRQNTMRDIGRELSGIVADLPSDYAVGLARFDSTVELLHPIDRARPELQSQLAALRAIGRHTELYRATQVAARVLAAHPAERKALFLVSDGLAEDRAYGHADTVAQARRNGVSIFGLGFPGATRDTVALQVLRRLSEDTGGVFAAAEKGRLPEWFRSVPAALDAAERIEIDLEPVLRSGLAGSQLAVLEADGAAFSETQIVLPEPPSTPIVVTGEPLAAQVAPEPVANPVPQRETAARVATPLPQVAVAAPSQHPGWRWGWLVASLLAAALLTLVIWAVVRARLKPFAYLCSLKNERLRYQVKTMDCRIGRHSDNELVLSDPSVSRFHAQLIRNRNGTYSIYDRASKNGVRVGSRPIASTLLREGDVIDLGRVKLRFTQYPLDLDRYADTVLYQSAASRFDKKRRRHERQAVAMRVRLYHDQVGWLNGQVRDLSADGAFIETERNLLPRTPIDMVVPVVEHDERRWLRFSGEIVRENNDGFGMLFTELEPSASRIIDALASSQHAPSPNQRVASQ